MTSRALITSQNSTKRVAHTRTGISPLTASCAARNCSAREYDSMSSMVLKRKKGEIFWRQRLALNNTDQLFEGWPSKKAPFNGAWFPAVNWKVGLALLCQKFRRWKMRTGRENLSRCFMIFSGLFLILAGFCSLFFFFFQQLSVEQ